MCIALVFCIDCTDSNLISKVIYFLQQDFLKFNEQCLRELPCHIFEPIPLGEGAGLGTMQEADSMSMPEGSTLYDLVQTGITYSHAAVGVVVRLRKELSVVKDVPVLIAIDQVPEELEMGNFILILHLMPYTADFVFSSTTIGSPSVSMGSL